MAISIPGVSPEMMAFLVSFIFVFAIVFALLVYSGIFRKKDEKAPKGPLAAIALVVAFVSAMYEPLTAFLWQALPIATMVLIVIFFIVFLKQLVKPGKKTDPIPAMVALAGFLLILAAMWEEVSNLLSVYGVSPDNAMYLAIIVVILLLFYFASKISEKEAPGAGKTD